MPRRIKRRKIKRVAANPSAVENNGVKAHSVEIALNEHYCSPKSNYPLIDSEVDRIGGDIVSAAAIREMTEMIAQLDSQIVNEKSSVTISHEKTYVRRARKRHIACAPVSNHPSVDEEVNMLGGYAVSVAALKEMEDIGKQFDIAKGDSCLVDRISGFQSGAGKNVRKKHCERVRSNYPSIDLEVDTIGGKAVSAAVLTEMDDIIENLDKRRNDNITCTKTAITHSTA